MAEVKIIRQGYFKWLSQDVFNAVCNVTLVKTGDLNILVDCGGAGESEEIKKSLESENLKVEDINILVLTHHHSDHAGGMSLFKNCLIVDWASKLKDGKYQIWREASLELEEDVLLIKTPGHTNECVSLIAETKEGSVAVVGDLWYSGGDEKLLVVWNKEKLLESRELIKNKADFIIPGHNEKFPAK